jgi:hypothetical protein
MVFDSRKFAYPPPNRLLSFPIATRTGEELRHALIAAGLLVPAGAPHAPHPSLLDALPFLPIGEIVPHVARGARVFRDAEHAESEAR